MHHRATVHDESLCLLRGTEETPQPDEGATLPMKNQRERQARLRAFSLVATAAALVPGGMGALLPAPKRFDCPQCGRAKLQRSATLSYCLRCSYFKKERP